MKRKHSFLILGLIALVTYLGLTYSKSTIAFDDVSSVQCYDPETVDSGYYVNFERKSDQAQFGTVSFAGKSQLADYGCRTPDQGESEIGVRVTCKDPTVVDDGYVLNFHSATSVKNQVAEVNVLKVQFSGTEKLTRLPCFSRK